MGFTHKGIIISLTNGEMAIDQSMEGDIEKVLYRVGECADIAKSVLRLIRDEIGRDLIIKRAEKRIKIYPAKKLKTNEIITCIAAAILAQTSKPLVTRRFQRL